VGPEAGESVQLWQGIGTLPQVSQSTTSPSICNLPACHLQPNPTLPIPKPALYYLPVPSLFHPHRPCVSVWASWASLFR
jgi:hypothetical protein